jgi:serine/threonine protein kinase/tetratricopeptide (TPR) repeat protein
MPTLTCPVCKKEFTVARAPASTSTTTRCSKCAAKTTRRLGDPPALSPLPQSRPDIERQAVDTSETVDMYATVIRSQNQPHPTLDDAPSGQKSTRIEPQPSLRSPGPKSAGNQLGPYHILAEIGRGGMGLVLKAHDGALKREVAIKTLLPDARKNPTHELRFIQEAQIAGQLEHPGIAPVHLLSRDEQGNGFFSMKLVSGKTLEEIVDKWHANVPDPEIRDEFPLVRLLSIFERVCETIGFAHSHRVVHRDLKPANVMIGEYGEVWVLDWGLAKVLGVPDPIEPPKPEKVRSSKDLPAPKSLKELESNVTLDGTVVGTPGYMAPEQAAGETVDEGVDIFGLGTLLYEILIGSAPFAGKTVRELLLNSAEGRIKPVPKKVRGRAIPKGLAAIAEKCLRFERRDRYATTAELLHDLRAYSAGDPISALPDSAADKLKRFARRHRAGLAWTGVIGAAMLAVIAAAAIRVWRQDTVAREEREKRLQAEVDKKSAEAASVEKDRHAHQLEIERESERAQRLQAELDKQKILAAGAEKAQRRLKAFEPYTEAMDLLMRGQLPEQSAKLLREALAIDPEFEEAQYALGEALRYSGDPAKAAAAYLKADQLSRSLSGKANLKALISAGFTFDGAGMYAEAEDAFAAAETGGANDPLAIVGRIFRAEHTRRLKDARVLAEDIVKKAPHLWETHFAYGYVLQEGMQDGVFPPEPTRKEALAEIRKALELSPRQAEVVVWLGIALARAGQSKEALENLDRAIALEPKNGNRYVQRWMITRQMGHSAGEISKDLDEARRLGASPIELKVCEMQQAGAEKDLEKAFTLLGEIVKKTHDWPSFLANWVIVGLQLGRVDEVRPAIDRLAKANPDFFVTFLLRARLIERTDPSGSLRILDEGIKSAPYAPGLHLQRAEVLFNLRRYDEALAAFDKTLELEPGHFRALCQKTFCLAMMKRQNEAVALFEQVKKDFPSNTDDLAKVQAFLDNAARTAPH